MVLVIIRILYPRSGHLRCRPPSLNSFHFFPYLQHHHHQERHSSFSSVDIVMVCGIRFKMKASLRVVAIFFAIVSLGQILTMVLVLGGPDESQPAVPLSSSQPSLQYKSSSLAPTTLSTDDSAKSKKKGLKTRTAAFLKQLGKKVASLCMDPYEYGQARIPVHRSNSMCYANVVMFCLFRLYPIRRAVLELKQLAPAHEVAYSMGLNEEDKASDGTPSKGRLMDGHDEVEHAPSRSSADVSFLHFMLDEVVRAWKMVFTQLMKPSPYLVRASAELYNVLEQYLRKLLPTDAFLFHGKTMFQWQDPVDFLELTLRFFEKYSILGQSFDNFFCKREVEGFEMHHIDVHIDSNCDSLASCVHRMVQTSDMKSLCSANNRAPSVLAIALNRIQFVGEKSKPVISRQSIELKDTIGVGDVDSDIPFPLISKEHGLDDEVVGSDGTTYKIAFVFCGTKHYKFWGRMGNMWQCVDGLNSHKQYHLFEKELQSSRMVFYVKATEFDDIMKWPTKEEHFDMVSIADISADAMNLQCYRDLSIPIE